MLLKPLHTIVLAALAAAVASSAFAQSATEAQQAPATIADVQVEAVPSAPIGMEPAVLGPLRYRGGVRLSAPGKRFRGWSGLYVSANGDQFHGVENGDWVSGTLAYSPTGDLAGLKLLKSGQLGDEAGRPFTTDLDKDAEALDFDGSRFIVGFEGRDRVNLYADLDGPATPVALSPEALAGIPPSNGFSSVVAFSRGRRLYLPEYTYPDPNIPVKGPTRTRGWLVTPKEAGAIWLRQSDGWLPVSLSALPDGDLLLLELEAAPGKTTTRTRLSRIAERDIKIAATLPATQLAVISPPTPGSRFEASSARRGPKGETLIYVLSNEGPAYLYLFELAR